MSPQKDSARPTLLVVEDEILVRMLLVDAFEDENFRVYEAAHADEALTILKARPDIQAVVTDVEMPGGSMDGFALARRVRETMPHLPVLITSGRQAPKAGDLPEGMYFLAKPFHTATLVQLLRSLLAGK